MLKYNRICSIKLVVALFSYFISTGLQPSDFLARVKSDIFPSHMLSSPLRPPAAAPLAVQTALCQSLRLADRVFGQKTAGRRRPATLRSPACGGRRRAANGKRRTASGERQAENGEQRAAGGGGGATSVVLRLARVRERQLPERRSVGWLRRSRRSRAAALRRLQRWSVPTRRWRRDGCCAARLDSASARHRTVDGGRWAVDERRTVEGGQWTAYGGRWTVEGGRWTVGDGRPVAGNSGEETFDGAQGHCGLLSFLTSEAARLLELLDFLSC